MTVKPQIAIVGFGRIGQALASDFSKSNRPFIASGNNLEEVSEASKKWNGLARPLDTAVAVKEADIIILAIPFVAILPFFRANAASLEGKIIIDPSNPYTMKDGKFSKLIGMSESAGEINASALPKGAKMAKALGTLGFDNLSAFAYQSPERATLFYATDDASINETIEQVIHDLGFDALRIGGIDQSIRIEIEGDLHQLYTLKGPVRLSEAKNLL